MRSQTQQWLAGIVTAACAVSTLAAVGSIAPAEAQASPVVLCAIDKSAQIDNSGTARMEEDESPFTGYYGGELADYRDGEAFYADGTMSNGNCWYSVADAPELF